MNQHRKNNYVCELPKGHKNFHKNLELIQKIPIFARTYYYNSLYGLFINTF